MFRVTLNNKLRNILRPVRDIEITTRPNSTNSNSSGGSGKVVVGLIGASGLAAGGTYLYAQYDDDFRKNLKENVPFTASLFNDEPVKKSPSVSKLASPHKVSSIIQSPPMPSLVAPKSSDEEESLLKKKQEREKSRIKETDEEKSDEKEKPKEEKKREKKLEKEAKKAAKVEKKLAKRANEPSASSDELSKEGRLVPSVEGVKASLISQEEREQLRDHYENELRKLLKNQLIAHTDHLQYEIAKIKEELSEKFNNVNVRNISKVKMEYNQKLRDSLLRLNNLERLFKARESLDTQEMKARQLWLLCQELQSSLKSNGVHGLLTIKPQVDVISDHVLSDDEMNFAKRLISRLPERALKEGVYNEDTLVKRFDKVEKLCKRVQLVGDNGGNLFTYLLSYAQSLLIVDSFKIPPEEISGEKAVDISRWDTFSIMARVRHCIEKRDLEQSLRYCNLLTGESRKVAKDWIEDVRLHLEVRQIANVLQGKATSITLQSLK